MTIEDSEQMLREFEQRIEDQLAQADRLKSEMELVRVEESSADGAVTVTVDSAGGLAGLELTRRAMRREPDELAEEILATARRAQFRLAAKMSEVMSGVLGAGSDTARFVADTYAERFAGPDVADPAGGKGNR